MALLAPPPQPPFRVALTDNDGTRSLRQRMRMVLLTLLLILATAWCFTLGVVPGVLAAMVAKHVIVAILVMGLGVDQDGRSAQSVSGVSGRPAL